MGLDTGRNVPLLDLGVFGEEGTDEGGEIEANEEAEAERSRRAANLPFSRRLVVVGAGPED